MSEPVTTARRAIQGMKRGITDEMVLSAPLLVGEDNPYGSDPRLALFCDPPRSAGGRLCRLVLGLTRREYLDEFDRVNLCSGKWSMREARATAMRILRERAAPIVLLGAKVAEAFDCGDYEPFSVHLAEILPGRASRVVRLPHPSGRCLAWNEPGAFQRAQDALRCAGVLS